MVLEMEGIVGVGDKGRVLEMRGAVFTGCGSGPDICALGCDVGGGSVGLIVGRVDKRGVACMVERREITGMS